MSLESDRIRAELENAGYAIAHFVEPALESPAFEGGFRFGASRGDQHVQLVAWPENLSEHAKALSLIHPTVYASRGAATKTIGRLHVEAMVNDAAAGRVEIAAIEPLFLPVSGDSFARIMRNVASRGWILDAERTKDEMTYDGPVWTIRAERDGEFLDAEFVFGPHRGPDRIDVDVTGRVHMTAGDYVFGGLTLSSRAQAELLLAGTRA